MQSVLQRFAANVSVQKPDPKCTTHAWFWFSVVIKPEFGKPRDQLESHLTEAGIEYRPIIAGNIAAQPAIKMYPHRISGSSLPTADWIHEQGLCTPLHEGLTKSEVGYICDVYKEFFES